LGCQQTGTAIVIDPKRDIDTYLEIAEQENLTITHITETHIHADFLSGSLELQSQTGAEILLSDEGPPEWQHQFLQQVFWPVVLWQPFYLPQILPSSYLHYILNGLVC
jgi:glyoxylase-like metal-dependent hydrolase (beta-lactamase superfamily II)